MRQVHTVVNVIPLGTAGTVTAIMFTDAGEPAIYNDTPAAELHCAKLREQFPFGTFRVITAQVL